MTAEHLSNNQSVMSYRLCTANSFSFPAGRTLTSVLNDAALAPGRAKFLARQIAEVLLAAHKSGIIHGNLDADHIFLEGSGSDERAVVKGFGFTHGDVRFDVYAFGELLEAMLPGHKLASECRSGNPNDRPDSFELILEELQDFSGRRTWIGSLLILAAVCSLFVHENSLRAPDRAPKAAGTSVQTQLTGR